MPYQLEKGPYFSVTEAVLDCCHGTDRLELLALLTGTTRTPLDDMPTLDSTSLDGGPRGQDNADGRRRHQNEEWYGMSRDKSGGWVGQPPFDPNNPQSTGYWHNWYGDAEEIVRQTFIRAIEVSLGIPHTAAGTDVSKLTVRHCWPIEVFWRCPAPWFEGWVTWRKEIDGSGRVTVHLHTPSHEYGALLMSPIRQPPASTRPMYELNPQTSDGARGMWVIAQEQQVKHRTWRNANAPGRSGHWYFPRFGAMIESRGAVVTVQTSEADGGVLPTGRPYQP
ncbi:MAG: hypothetical protein JOZ99_06085 [Actinobacteria bacterium]|nr:hypothetical protein [Actinomycetota bacterium]